MVTICNVFQKKRGSSRLGFSEKLLSYGRINLKSIPNIDVYKLHRILNKLPEYFFICGRIFSVF